MRPFVLFLGLLMLCGCAAPTNTHYLGARFEPQNILPLPAESVTGLSWKDLYLQIGYALERQGDELTIIGELAFADYPKGNLARLRDLSLVLYLLDGQGVVRQYGEISRPLGHDLDTVFPFRRQLALLPEVQGMAFGYEGELVTEEGGIQWFWKRPKR